MDAIQGVGLAVGRCVSAVCAFTLFHVLMAWLDDELALDSTRDICVLLASISGLLGFWFVPWIFYGLSKLPFPWSTVQAVAVEATKS